MHLSTTRQLLRPGNAKLGESIYTFSIPAWDTCPGKSRTCTHCYALRGRFTTGVVVRSFQANLKAARSRGFARRMATEIRARGVRTLRVHVSGDFFSAAYARAWLNIVRACPRTQFFAFTRSWRVRAIEPVLRELAGLPNVRLHYSTDDDTGLPTAVPETVRLAHLAVKGGTVPHEADLVFLDYSLRKKGAKYFNGVLGCPAETVGLTCQQCRLCIDPLADRDARRYRRPATGSARIPLPLLI